MGFKGLAVPARSFHGFKGLACHLGAFKGFQGIAVPAIGAFSGFQGTEVPASSFQGVSGARSARQEPSVCVERDISKSSNLLPQLHCGGGRGETFNFLLYGV